MNDESDRPVADGDAVQGAAAAKAELQARRAARRARKESTQAESPVRRGDEAKPPARPANPKAARRARQRDRRLADKKPDGAPAASILVDVQSKAIARRARRRALINGILVWLSFIVLVAAPSAVAGWYLNFRAADQYASEIGFAVRSLDGQYSSPLTDLLGSAASDSTAGDSQMLYEFLQSQPMVELIDADVDLEETYNRPEADWVFAMGRDRTIEEKVDYWNQAVTISYDTSGGLIYVEVKAFRADDAKRVAEAVLQESTTLINGLTTEARQDAVRFARVDLMEAEQRIRNARVALQRFRASQGTADVAGDISQEMSLISNLRSQRSSLQADYDSRKDILGENSPTLSALRRRIESVDQQIAEAEARIATDPGAQVEETGDGSTTQTAGDTPGGRVPAAASGALLSDEFGGRAATLAEAAGRQEELKVELELATHMYTGAQASLEAARAEARRAQRYLATHIRPTLAQEAQYPERIIWTAAIFGILLIAWSILLLIVSSIRDRS